MSAPDSTAPTFEIAHESAPGEALLAGFSNFGLAGLTAVDYLVDQLDIEQTGHVTADELPAITPFENGTPRHHTRFFGGEDSELTVLVGELFIPLSVAGAFGDAIMEWVTDRGVDEATVLSGVPIPHGPEEHRTYYVATEDYQERNLGDTDIAPMGQGFLDGVNAELVARGIESPLATAVLVTPVHAQAPDIEAAIRLVEAVNAIYDLGVDTGPLQSFAEEVRQHYEDLADRIESVEAAELPEDRMYM